jgi:hypothetical protein
MAAIKHLDLVSILFSSCVALLVYITSIALYRIILHPLAKIPGPKLAALTLLYQTYYCTRNNQSRFYKQVELLHKQYGMSQLNTDPISSTSTSSSPKGLHTVTAENCVGPVVRIAPNEISLSDPVNYEKIYNVGSKFYKDPDFYGALGADSAAFTTISNELHRIRRRALDPMFSRKVVLELEAVVQDKANKLSRRLEKGLEDGSANGVNMHHGFRAVSVDVITEYAFNDCYNQLDKDDFGHSFFAMVKGTIGAFWIFMQFPLLQAVALNLPPWLVFNPTIRLFNAYLAVSDSSQSQLIYLKEHRILEPRLQRSKTVSSQGRKQKDHPFSRNSSTQITLKTTLYLTLIS